MTRPRKIRTPRRRALEALVELARKIVGKRREEIADALLSAITNLEIALNDTHGIHAHADHVSFQGKNPKLWMQLEMHAWSLVCRGAHSPLEALQDLEKMFAKELKMKFPVRPSLILKLATTPARVAA